MRITLSFALLFAACTLAALPAAYAQDHAARWAGTWTVEDESGHGVGFHMTLKDSGGRITGHVVSPSHDNPIEYAAFKASGDLRIRFENVWRDRADCTFTLEPGGDALHGTCLHLMHGDEGWRRVNGVREKPE